MVRIVFVVSKEHLAKSSRAQVFGVVVYLVVELQLLCTLLLHWFQSILVLSIGIGSRAAIFFVLFITHRYNII